MVQPLSGLSPGTSDGYPSFYGQSWVDPYEEYASPAEQVHYGQYTWDVPPPMPWLLAQDETGWVDVPAPESGVGQAPPVLGAGMDPALAMAPIETGSHNAPFPSFGLEDSVPFNTDRSAQRLAESQAIHAADTGQAAAYVNGPEAMNQWTRTDINDEYAGQSLLDPAVPDQLKSARGLDQVQGFGRPPLFDPAANAAFVRMPGAHGDVPGSWMWLDPAVRPVEVRPTGYRDWPVGEMSPFTGQVPGTHGLGDPTAAVITTAPPEYAAPPEPAVSAPLPDTATWAAW